MKSNKITLKIAFFNLYQNKIVFPSFIPVDSFSFVLPWSECMQIKYPNHPLGIKAPVIEKSNNKIAHQLEV